MFHVYCNHDHVSTADTIKMAVQFIENDRTDSDWYVINTGHGLTVLDETKGIDNVNDYMEEEKN